MITIEDFKKLELRVAEIIHATLHPQADRLLVLQVRVGEEERTVVAGIRRHYSEPELIGKKVVLVANLEPAQIRGITSQGMLLAASIDEALTLVVPERDIQTGARIS